MMTATTFLALWMFASIFFCLCWSCYRLAQRNADLESKASEQYETGYRHGLRGASNR